MLPYPNIDPEIVRIGPVAIRWYGVMYIVGFVSSYLLVRHQMKHPPRRTVERPPEFPPGFLDALYLYIVTGLIIGARLGYVLFYDLSAYLRDPFAVFALWRGGMSFHGGLIGVVIAGWWCCRRFRVNPLRAADLVVVTAPIGLGLGRIGNFINAELYGRVAGVPWAMVFPGGGPLPRHPSQLYEFLLEGVALFTILWLCRGRGWRPGMLGSLFLVLYGVFRFFVEFFREPDPQLGFILGPFTMGQALSASMIVLGGFAALLIRRRKVHE